MSVSPRELWFSRRIFVAKIAIYLGDARRDARGELFEETYANRLRFAL